MKAQRRGKNIALAGAGLQGIFTLALLAVGAVTGAKSAMACTWYLAGGVLPWLMAALLFYARQLELQEAAELAELATRGETGGLFERDRDLSLRPAAARRAFIDRWIVPIFTQVLAVYYVALGILVLSALRFLVREETISPIRPIAPGLLFTLLVGFVAFLFSRYCTGMSSRPEWRPLRAPASYLLLGFGMLVASAASFAMAHWGYRMVDVVVAFAVPIAQLVLAAELEIGFILDLFRPRVPGRERRLTFDSRICGLLAEPARVGHSVAETLNYQFGFEVSRTWFYRLLGKALVPLLIFGAIVLFLMSSVVIVYQGQKCVVLHWGRRDAGRLLGPGIHVKWPWPVDTARHFDVERAYELRVGVGEQREPKVVKGRELRLWTDEHGRWRELDFLVARPPRGSEGGEAATQPAGPSAGRPQTQATTPPAGDEGNGTPPPVSIIKLVVSVLYQIEDPYKFGYRFTDARGLLEAVAHREMVRYCASATLDTKLGDPDPNRPEAIMTSGWGKASRVLEQRIRKAVGPAPKGLDLGVRIRTVKLVAVHPPAQAADAFEAVFAAERGQDQDRYRAEGEANRLLSNVAGDPDSGLELALAITQLEHLENLATRRGRKEDFDRDLRGHILRTGASLRTLLREIRREELRGRLGRTGGPATRPGRQAQDFPASLTRYLPQADEGTGQLLRELLADGSLDGLSGSGGTPKQRLARRYALHLLELLEIRSRADQFDFATRTRAARDRADTLFDRATGEPARKIAEANAYRVKREMAERAKAEAFRRELLAYRASPRMYVFDRWLDVWDEVLPNVTKYVVGVDPNRVEVWMNWERETRGLKGAFDKVGSPE